MSATRGGTDGAAPDALGDRPAPLAEGRHEPATIGVEAFALELDGVGGAIHRFALGNTGDALVGIVANRHSSTAEGDKLTHERVDHLMGRWSRLLAVPFVDLVGIVDGPQPPRLADAGEQQEESDDIRTLPHRQRDQKRGRA